jgi:tetratricopeptide (TPR) repeat protein
MRRLLFSLLGLLAIASPAAAQRRNRPPTLDSLLARAQRDSLDPSAHYELSIGYWRAKRYDDEARALRRAIAIDPRYAPAYYSLALQVYDRRPKLWDEEEKRKVPPAWRDSLENSYRLRRQAFLIDPMVDLRVVGTEAPPEEMVVLPDYGEFTTYWLFEIAMGSFGAARYELSYSSWQKFVERMYAGKPQDSIPSFVFFYRGLAAGHRGIHNVAIADFRTLLDRAVTRERSDSLIQIPLETNDYRYILATLHERAGKPADAVALYKEAIANDLGLFMARVRLAGMYRQFRQWNDAIAEARRAIEANPDDPTAVRELGEILYEARRYDEAEAALKEAQNKNPHDQRTTYILGVLYQTAGRHAEARQAYDRFLAVAPAGPYRRELEDARARLSALPGQ